MDSRDSSKGRAYALRFKLIFDYIHKHLDQSLTVEQLSQVANLSKFHFHRQFTEYCGVSVSRYIQLMRLKRASYRLAFNPLMPIIEIALDAGFENPESFSRAFKNLFGQTPSAFRRKPAWDRWGAQYKFMTAMRYDILEKKEVQIVTVPGVMVAVLEHHGPLELVNDTAMRFIEWRRCTGLSPVEHSQTIGVPYSDPETTPPKEFRFDICGSITEPVLPNEYGVVTKEIPGGRCAVLRHIGAHERLGESVHYLYRQWLPESGEELRDFPVYFHYLNIKLDVPDHELITDVCLPLL